MSDQNGLRYLFDQPNLNVRQTRWLATLSEFDFEIKYINGKENWVADSLSRKVVAIRSYGTELQDKILQASEKDFRYMDIVHRLQQGFGTSTCDSTCTSSGTSIDGSTCTDIGTSIGAGAQGMDYCLTPDGFVKFRNRIYVSDKHELKKVTLREFHVKPYLGHPGYQKKLTTMRISVLFLTRNASAVTVA